MPASVRQQQHCVGLPVCECRCERCWTSANGDEASSFGVVGSQDEFARWQGQLQQLLGKQAAFQTAVSFARTGRK